MDIRIHLDVIPMGTYRGFLGTCLIFLGTFYRSWLYHICIYALSKLRFHFSVFTFPLAP